MQDVNRGKWNVWELFKLAVISFGETEYKHHANGFKVQIIHFLQFILYLCKKHLS